MSVHIKDENYNNSYYDNYTTILKFGVGNIFFFLDVFERSLTNPSEKKSIPKCI